ncbi:Uncharacterised protein [Streptococcus pneumoniae]|uniref:hypothetical protein n=1 Tax=Streptococcus pneumoniae TaxID=1313 RepID=UPI000B588224|nr:hypothetical protein [Streptococcus pneumoniae]SNG87811.1 Uncharacterised protein [Streptococcus pneumoniae]VNW08212.1 Uncharacterised protein [Streptococcus pneumoniae]HET4958707.1 hypothetical protein [Streptococcus pneumoniae]HET5507078.1 hypothetical protein [Streptococcus pneumoniae]HET5946050.1 hypothetical protein [Streptococcus pneumoniae]
MPNWAEGTLKLRGRRENVASALKEMLLGNEGATLEEEYDGTLLRFKNEYDYFYINGTRRAFISSKFDVDIKIFTFEMGMEFTQEIEISKGEIIKNIVNENFTNYSWDVPFSRLGG